VRTVTLTVVGNEMEADMVCGMLRANGIECFHRKADTAGEGIYGETIAGPTEVMVEEDDLADARELLPRR
jgi:hypothetical protein